MRAGTPCFFGIGEDASGGRSRNDNGGRSFTKRKPVVASCGPELRAASEDRMAAPSHNGALSEPTRAAAVAHVGPIRHDQREIGRSVFRSVPARVHEVAPRAAHRRRVV